MTNIEIIAGSTKIKKVEDILVNIDLIADLVKEDSVRIIRSTGGFCDETFEEKYAEAIKWTKKQLNKHHLKLYQKIFQCGDIKVALQLLLVRITANVKNQFDAKRKNTVGYWNSKKKATLNSEVMEKINAADPLQILLDAEMQILAEEDAEKNIEKYKNEIKEITKIVKVGNHFQLEVDF